ncbi:MAG: hypothetical protein NTW05_05910, partial [Pseudonocardiales bacterium]|nr:hypothetical protein [Pseudonocardiales bacterium]
MAGVPPVADAADADGADVPVPGSAPVGPVRSGELTGSAAGSSRAAGSAVALKPVDAESAVTEPAGSE